MGSTSGLGATATEPFRHEAFLYRGRTEFVDGIARFVRESIAASEPILLAVSRTKEDELREELGDELDSRSDEVLFTDMVQLGRNPGRIIPAWRDFLLTRHDAKRVRGVGEPVWAGRSDAELREAQRHESLLGVAFTNLDDFWLMCPYDVHELSGDVIEEAYRSHPYVLESGRSIPSHSHAPHPGVPQHLDDPLTDPPMSAHAIEFGHGELSQLRRVVGSWADGNGMDGQRRELLVLAVNELTTNSVEHGGGAGRLLLWTEGGTLVAEVRDGGFIAAPLVGRVRPDQQQGGGRGVWLVNQVCDLVQIRSVPTGTVVRVHMAT